MADRRAPNPPQGQQEVSTTAQSTQDQQPSMSAASAAGNPPVANIEEGYNSIDIFDEGYLFDDDDDVDLTGPSSAPAPSAYVENEGAAQDPSAPAPTATSTTRSMRSAAGAGTVASPPPAPAAALIEDTDDDSKDSDSDEDKKKSVTSRKKKSVTSRKKKLIAKKPIRRRGTRRGRETDIERRARLQVLLDEARQDLLDSQPDIADQLISLRSEQLFEIFGMMSVYREWWIVDQRISTRQTAASVRDVKKSRYSKKED